MNEKLELKYVANSQTIYVWVETEKHRLSGTFLRSEDETVFNTLDKALKENNAKAIKEIVSLKFDLVQAINSFGDGKIGFDSGDLFYVTNDGDKNRIDSRLTRKIKDLISAGSSPDILIRFLDNLIQNPDQRAIKDFYDFLIVNNLAMTEDGHFLAYKIVRDDYKDLHSGTMDNSPGLTVRMPRNKVNPDPDQTCSYGLHICSKDYLPQYGGFFGSGRPHKILVLKVNPANVCAFPKDYKNAKCRVCEYEVVGDFAKVEKDYLVKQIARLEQGVTVDVETVKRMIKEALAE